MGKDVKIGLALGLVVVMVAIVIFSTEGEEQLTRPPRSAAPLEGHPDDSSPISPSPPASPLGEEEVLRTVLGGPAPLWEGSKPAPASEERKGAAETPPRTPPHTTPTAIEPTPTVPSQKPTETVQHLVRPGDTLWGLAKRYYGNPLLLDKIWRANRHLLPTTETPLQVGMNLTIPEVPTTEPSPTPEGTREYDTYRVRPGDTLSIIALRFYGDQRMTAPIVKANPRLSGNPDRLLVGWKLRIPRIAAVDRRGDID